MSSESNVAENQETNVAPVNFIRNYITQEIEDGKLTSEQVVTRFPPEPNGYLHIGHAKTICLNFGLAKHFQGRCHLRFDDTNPVAEDQEYVESIQDDVRWLGFDWNEHIYYASDRFEKFFEWALELVDKGLAYVDDSPVDELRKMRGTLTEPGQNSPYRERSVEENRELLLKMRSGEFEDGSRVLRAKIDMSSPNMNMRDPIVYRIRRAHHQRTGDDWCIYPMYDFAHGLTDLLEGVTHSICTLEFEDHRPLYNWFLEVLETENRPQQIEFARMKLDYTVLSKRKLLELVEKKIVTGWDDPRMPTLQGMKRRGFRPESIRTFCERVGVTRKESVIALSTLEHCVREDLNEQAPRVMGVLDPIKVVIENFPQDSFENGVEWLEGPVHPQKPELGRRSIPLTREVYIDAEDFMEDPPKKYFRLKPDGKVRLRYGYVIHCHEVVKDESGRVVELKCTYNVETKGGVTPEGEKKVKGIIHWVSASQGAPVEVRLYDRLFSVPDPAGDKERDYKEFLNPASLKVLRQAVVEPAAAKAQPGDFFQFERLGFFSVDPDSDSDKLVFNRTVTLKDTWAKLNKN